MKIASALLLAAACATAAAQCPHNSYAIKNATVITVSGSRLTGASVVMCNGVITAVGADAAIPADAEVLDATGLTVYPGFVDGFSQYGLPEERAAGRGARPDGAEVAAAQAREIAATLDGIPVNDPRRYLDPQPEGVESDRRTAELLDPPATLQAVRDSGVLASLVAPADGIFKGEAALVNLVGPDAPAMLIQPRAGQVIELRPAGGGGDGYPASVMGAVAVYRQTLLDARRLQTEIGIYQKAGEKGLPPPHYDPKTSALIPLLEHQQAAYFVASDWDAILRALKLADEFHLTTPTIIGATEADKAIPQLQAAHAAVLVSLSFAPAAAGGGFGRGGASPEVQARQRQAAEAVPAALAKAGVTFGFATYGMTARQQVVEQVKAAMRRGLSEADAWKALTLWPAQIVGAGNQLGSIETGKIANLVVASGDPLTGDSSNQWIVADGRLLPVHPAERPARGGDRAAGGNQ